MKWYDPLGYGSAATLGFIAGNVPGAVGAVGAYNRFARSRKLTKNYSMARDVSMSRSTSRGRQLERSTSSQRRVRAKHNSKSSSKSSVLFTPRTSRISTQGSAKSNRAGDRAISSRLNLVSQARRKRTVKGLHKAVKSQKKVKVSRVLRKKINEVISERAPHGYLQLGSMLSTTESVPNQNQQTNDAVKGFSCDGINGEFFSPTQVMDAASVLWGHKVKTLPGGSIPAAPIFNDTANFNTENCKINVLKQWAAIKYRNNGERNLNVYIYACKRKVIAQTANAAVTDYQAAVAEEITNGVNVYNQAGAAGTGSDGVSPTVIGFTPYLAKGFMKMYDVEVTKVYLAPGEEYVYTISGPSKVYDYRKFMMQGNQYPFQKTNVSLFHTVYGDLIGCTGPGGNNGTFGRFSESNLGTGYGLVYETNMYFKLEMPEQAGIKWQAAGHAANQAEQTVPADGLVSFLGQRRDAYGVFYYGNVFGGTRSRIDREQPATGENPQ